MKPILARIINSHSQSATLPGRQAKEKVSPAFSTMALWTVLLTQLSTHGPSRSHRTLVQRSASLSAWELESEEESLSLDVEECSSAPRFVFMGNSHDSWSEDKPRWSGILGTQPPGTASHWSYVLISLRPYISTHRLTPSALWWPWAARKSELTLSRFA